MKPKNVEPRRLLDDARTPSKARLLLENARPVPPLSPAARARSAALTKQLSAAPPSATQPSSGDSTWGTGSIWGGVVVTALAMVVVGSTIIHFRGENARGGGDVRGAGDVPAAATATVAAPPPTPRFPEVVPAPPDEPTVDVASLPGIAKAAPFPSRPASARAAPPPVATAPAAASGEPADAETLAREAKLLEAARKALSVDPVAALAILDDHARTYPQGSLAAEREYLAVRVLARLGRRDDAERRATKFVATYPGSPYRARLTTTLGAP